MTIASLRLGMAAVVAAMLAACSTTSPEPPYPGPAYVPLPPPALLGLPSITQSASRWVPVPWQELPGLSEDALHEAWNAWVRSCERPHPAFQTLCPQVRRLSIGTPQEQRAFLFERLQPYRVETNNGAVDGLLTGYYEPEMNATRLPSAGYNVPLYSPPANLGARKPWYSRQQIDTLPEAQTALQGRVIAWVSDPIEALVLHIQGSGRLRITEPDGRVRLVRLAFAGTNDHPYRSVGRWLLDQDLIRDASWPGIKAWIAQNPQRVQEMLWSNPRYVFFKEEPLQGLDKEFGPKGAQGVALTPGRSIAVDRQSIPYGTPVWMASSGPTGHIQRLVLAQDTGSAIVGAVRADYFTGWGSQAGDIAGRLKQNLRLWVLWPR
ncbi:MAG: MltA domain-containing protein [Giesbergeria sp.]|uniref:murein transglycosylase A n=1 Tax=Giesbergeria sp. TaxID=2818473 RepID=UPI00260424A7|nr:MltA domain-containing protein [Giesbergeria sp.]MDD2610552.1 MltA domain-containing protein [Giesbergeria sp.]